MNSELSPREIQVVSLMADGLGNEEIAAILDLSADTVKVHARRIATKLEVSGRSSTRAAIVAVSIRGGIIP